MARTKFPPSPAQPEASTFISEAADLKIIRAFEADDYAPATPTIKMPIEVRHRACKALVIFEPDLNDPVMSEYCCDSYYCNFKWPLRDVLKMRYLEIATHFYTVLRENDEDLKERPWKSIEIDNGRQRYSTTRLCTDEEMMASRIKRLLEIRSNA